MTWPTVYPVRQGIGSKKGQVLWSDGSWVYVGTHRSKGWTRPVDIRKGKKRRRKGP